VVAAEYRTTVRLAPKWTELPKYPVTAGTVLLAIGVTIAWWSKVDISPLFETAMIRRGEIWRLFTSAFPHTGILHLAFNVYWIWVFGTLAEEVYGHLKTAALLALFAFGSGSFEFALAAGGVGLSGVGYGLFGLFGSFPRGMTVSVTLSISEPCDFSWDGSFFALSLPC